MNEKTPVSIAETTLDHLVPDDKNFNRGTEFGNAMIEKSLRRLGAGRSIVLDKNDRIIAGNKTVENAVVAGFDKVIVVETTGDQIVAVKRVDIDIDSKKGRELALADNATSKANLAWDEELILAETSQWDIDPAEWGINMPEPDIDEEEPIPGDVVMYEMTVQHDRPEKLTELQIELAARGFTCELK